MNYVDEKEICRVIRENNVLELCLMLKKGLDPNMILSGRFPLVGYLAGIDRASTDILQILIDAGADVNAKYPVVYDFHRKDIYSTPLSSAAVRPQTLEFIRLLVDKGAIVDMEATTPYGADTYLYLYLFDSYKWAESIGDIKGMTDILELALFLYMSMD